jgi:HD-like signal output (HDOD) protein
MSNVTAPCSASVQNLLGNESLRKLVADLKTLPSLPTLYQDLTRELQQAEPSIERIGRIISQDLAMLTKVLQVVNSPFYGLARRVTTASQAVALLGLDTIKSLVLTSKIFEAFDQSKLPFFNLDILWQHGVTTGANARKIAKDEQAPPAVLEDTVMAGMLHDIGQLVIASNLPERYTDMLALMQEQSLPECEAEEQVLGATHAAIGGYLLGLWGLNDAVVEAVAFHHYPARAQTRTFSPLTAVHIANAIEEEEQAAAMGDTLSAVDFDYLDACELSDRLPIWRALLG